MKDYPADHPHATDNAFRRCGMLREGGFRRLGRPMQIERVRRRMLSLKRRCGKKPMTVQHEEAFQWTTH